MTPEHRERWEREIQARNEPLKKPRDLLRRAVSSEDFVDSAVVGGVGVADILAGRVAESQIPSDVITAFHEQYPQYGASFVDAVRRHAGSPDQLTGLISGIKGKLFEIDYVDWLNQGHLPVGWTAELAEQANNPGWDIAIRDPQGHVDEVLQLKATESLSYVHEAIAAHPDIDVVVPHELYERLASHPQIAGNIIDGHQTLGDLNDHVISAADHAEAGGSHIDFPIVAPFVAVAFAAYQNHKKYRDGRVTLTQALTNVYERGVLATVASASGWAVGALTHASVVGIPVAMAVRLAGGQVIHNRNRREVLSMYIDTISASRRKLEDHILRPLLEG